MPIGRFTFDTIAVGEVSLQVLDPNDFNRQVANGRSRCSPPATGQRLSLRAGPGAGRRHHSRHRLPSRRLPLARRRGAPDRSGQRTYIPYTADAQGKYEIPDLALNKPHHLVVVGGAEVINATVTLWYGGQVKTVDLHPFALGTVTGTT